MISIDQFLSPVITGSGFWRPLVWILVAIIAFLVAYVLRSFGTTGYKRNTEQAKVFLSGNKEYSEEQMHVKASNLYWGFTTSMDWFYKLLKKLHTGNASDYVLWFVIVLAIFFILGVI